MFFFDYLMETSAKYGINTSKLFINYAIVLYEQIENLINKIKNRKTSWNDSESIWFGLLKEDYYEDVDQCNC